MKKLIVGLVMTSIATLTWAVEPSAPGQQWRVYDAVVKKTVVTTNKVGHIIKTTPVKQVWVMNTWADSSTNTVAFTIGNTSISSENYSVADSYETVVSNKLYKGSTNNCPLSGKQIVTLDVASTDGLDVAVLIGTDTWSQKWTGTDAKTNVTAGAVTRSISCSGAGVNTDGDNYKTATVRYNAKQSKYITNDLVSTNVISSYLKKLASKATNTTEIVVLPPSVD